MAGARRMEGQRKNKKSLLHLAVENLKLVTQYIDVEHAKHKILHASVSLASINLTIEVIKLKNTPRRAVDAVTVVILSFGIQITFAVMLVRLIMDDRKFKHRSPAVRYFQMEKKHIHAELVRSMLLQFTVKDVS